MQVRSQAKALIWAWHNPAKVKVRGIRSEQFERNGAGPKVRAVSVTCKIRGEFRRGVWKHSLLVPPMEGSRS